jgi:hypothetical protein
MEITITSAEVQRNGVDVLVKFKINKQRYSQMFSSSTSVEEIKNYIVKQAEKFAAANKLANDIMLNTDIST